MTDFETPTSACPIVLANDPNYFANDPLACAGNPSTPMYLILKKVATPKGKVTIKQNG